MDYAKKIYTLNGTDYNASSCKGKKILHIGCGHSKIHGATGVDSLDLSEVDVVHDLDKTPWPVEQGTYDLVFAHSVLEHLDSIPTAMQQIYDSLRPGGHAVLTVPYFRHLDAVTDPTHKHFFCARSLDYFLEEKSSLAEYDYTDTKFKATGFWYGWPHPSNKTLVRFLKKMILARPKFYDQYLSILFPVKILIWELEKVKNSGDAN